MAKICYFLSINKAWLNPFKYSETIGNYEGIWYITLVGWTIEDDLQATKENLDMLEDDQNLLFPSNWQGQSESI